MARKPTLSVVHSDANPMPPAPDKKPSRHQNHSSVYENETKLRLAGFDSGITSLNSELDSRNDEYHKTSAKMQADHDAAMQRLSDDYHNDCADLYTRIEDMQIGKAMAAAALDTYVERLRIRKEGEAQ